MIKNTFNVWHMILFLLFLIQYLAHLHKRKKGIPLELVIYVLEWLQ